MIKDLIKKFPKNYIGYSDHTLPDNNMESLFISYVYGARVIEKHFTHDKKLKGNDHYHAMDCKDLLVFKNRLKKYNILKGNEEKSFIQSELKSRVNARRSIVSNFNLKKGHKITLKDLDIKRPGTGLSPMLIKKIIGKTLKISINRDQVFKKKHFNSI